MQASLFGISVTPYDHQIDDLKLDSIPAVSCRPSMNYKHTIWEYEYDVKMLEMIHFSKTVTLTTFFKNLTLRTNQRLL